MSITLTQPENLTGPSAPELELWLWRFGWASEAMTYKIPVDVVMNGSEAVYKYIREKMPYFMVSSSWVLSPESLNTVCALTKSQEEK